MVDPGTARGRLDVEPGVESLQDTVLEGDVDVVGTVPSVAGDDRAGKVPEEGAVLPGDHGVVGLR